MRHGSAGARWMTLTTSLVMALALWAAPTSALAQDNAAPPPPPPPPPPPAAEPPPPMAPPAAVATEAKPPTSAEAMPAARPDALPPIDVGAWTRIGSVFQGTDPKKINDWHMDHANIELHAGGKIHKKVGVTLNLIADIANYGTTPNPSDAPVQVEDAIIQFDFMDEFHLWAGHLLVPVDRANASGPFFMIPWNYPGIVSVGGNTQFWLPREGNFGRNNGAVIWGDLVDNKLTYLVGAFDNGNVGSSPLISGRLRLALWDTEPGFWGNCSFFGDKDMLSVGVGAQYQKAPGGSNNYSEVNADVLVEKKLGGGAFVTGEVAYYHYSNSATDLNFPLSDSAYVLLAYATPTIGVGNIQPMARFQWFKLKNDGAPKPMNLDVGVAYLVKGPALRVLATYSYTKFDTDVTANAIQLGAQAIFF